MTKPFAFLFLAVCGVLLLSSPQARADIPSTCGSLDSLINCAATDVGKPCQGGGQCFEMSCLNTGASTSVGKVYRCDACPTVLAAPGTCTITNMGTACTGDDGGTGTCRVIAPHCATTSKFVCQTPAAAAPTGPPLTTVGGKTELGGDGCDIAPGPGKPTMIGLGLVGVGLAFFLIDRARRRSR
jgi:MYXO-CTERM domain-containing protein